MKPFLANGWRTLIPLILVPIFFAVIYSSERPMSSSSGLSAQHSRNK